MIVSKHLSLGERIRFARKAAGLSHDRLGAIAGTSRQHLIRLEKGQHKPKPEMVARIAEATGKPVAFFENGDEDDEEAASMAADLMRALDRWVTNRVERAAA